MRVYSTRNILVMLFLIALVFSLCACGEQINTDKSTQKEQDYLEQAVTVWLLTEQVSYQDNQEYSRFAYAYDEDGNLTEECFYSRGEQLTHYEYCYDATGNLNGKLQHNANGDTTQYTFSYEYDEQGNIIKTIQYKDTVEDSITTFICDLDGKLLEESVFQNGNEITKTRFSYDLKGNKISKECILDEQVIWRYAYKYDRNNRETEWIVYQADDTERERYVYSYNPAGSMTSCIYYAKGVLAYETKYMLNDQGIPVGWTQGTAETGTYDYQIIECPLQQAYALQDRYGTGRVIIQQGE